MPANVRRPFDGLNEETGRTVVEPFGHIGAIAHPAHGIERVMEQARRVRRGMTGLFNRLVRWTSGGWQLWLLVRRHRERPEERADFFCRGPADTPWTELVRVAGQLWRVEALQHLAGLK